MKLRSPLLIRVFAAGLALVIGCWSRTLRVRIASADGRQHPVDPVHGQYFYAFWHEGLLGPLTTACRIKMLISQHADGELIAQACEWLGVGVIRGSTSRGGCEAIQSLINESQSQTHLGITPDGPRGPRRKLQMGMIWVASVTGLPIVLLGIGFSHAWRLRSWDRFAVPKPGSTVCGVLSEPILIPPDLDRAGLERWRLFTESKLLEMTNQAEAWAERIADQGSAAAPPTFAQPTTEYLLQKSA
ncbi:lysophospholipid acyltransferase family protein [Anatilimnocola sp. NA78]|uniref:lysophospholipid acyltransferase family protein n=1 Tax=Anatilimnocola sp. NA78 TaxID=3415683 RepID=UPI003CE49302